MQGELGRRLFLGPDIRQTQPSPESLAMIRERAHSLQQAAEDFIRAHYLDYHKRVEAIRNREIAILIEDLERFDRGALQQLEARRKELGGAQEELAFIQDAVAKGQRTRLENQIKMHCHRMQERRREIESMQLGDFPAPELLNMVLVTPA